MKDKVKIVEDLIKVALLYKDTYKTEDDWVFILARMIVKHSGEEMEVDSVLP